MLKIRMQRVGRKHEPVFRLVLTDSRSGPKSGKVIEILGSYDSRRGEKAEFKTDRIKYWISIGAQTSNTVHNMLISKEIIKGKKVSVITMSGKRKKKIEEKLGTDMHGDNIPGTDMPDSTESSTESSEKEKESKKTSEASEVVPKEGENNNSNSTETATDEQESVTGGGEDEKKESEEKPEITSIETSIEVPTKKEEVKK